MFVLQNKCTFCNDHLSTYFFLKENRLKMIMSLDFYKNILLYLNKILVCIKQTLNVHIFSTARTNASRPQRRPLVGRCRPQEVKSTETRTVKYLSQ